MCGLKIFLAANLSVSAAEVDKTPDKFNKLFKIDEAAGTL
jgi:hypothetical protein